MRLLTVTSLISAALGLGLLWPSHAALAAISIDPGTNYVADATSVQVNLSTNVPGTAQWCVDNYPIKRWYPTGNPLQEVLSSCNPGLLDQDHGWVTVGNTAGGPPATLSFPILHLAPNTGFTIRLHVTEVADPSKSADKLQNEQTLTKLAFTGGPNISNSRYDGGSKTYKADIRWTTSHDADTQIEYAPAAAAAWKVRVNGVATVFTGVAVGQNSTAVAVGSGGRIYRSDDVGKTWNIVNTGLAINFSSVAAGDMYTFWTVGWDSEVYLSDDGGKKWTPTSIRHRLKGVAAPRADVAIAVGWNGLVMETLDQGATWITIPTPADTSTNTFQQIAAVSDSSFWIVGEAGKILHTSNRGLTWINTAPTTDTVVGVTALDDTTAYVSTIRGEVWKSTNGGVNWTPVFASGGSSIFSLVAASNGDVWAVGDNGKVFHYINSTATWVPVVDPAILNVLYYGSALISYSDVLSVGDNGTIIQYSIDYCTSGVCATPDAARTAEHLNGPPPFPNNPPVVMDNLSCMITHYAARAKSKDSAGMTIADVDQPFDAIACVDTVAPTVQILPALPQYTNQAVYPVRGKAKDNVGVAKLLFAAAPSAGPPPVPGDPPSPPVPALPSAPDVWVDWTYNAALIPNVKMKVYAHAEDATPNAADDTGETTLDLDLPVVTVTQPATPPAVTIFTRNNFYDLKATVTDNFGVASVTMVNQTTGNSFPAAATGMPDEWGARVNLNDGSNLVKVVAVDVATNSATKPVAPQMYNIVVDVNPPTATITQPADNQCLNDGNNVAVKVDWTDDSGLIDRVELDPGNGVWQLMVPDAGNTWKATINLIADETTIRARSWDKSGQPSPIDSHLIKLDTHAPTAAIISPVDGSTIAANTVPMNGTLDDTQGGTVYSCGLAAVEIHDTGGFHLAADQSWQGTADLVPGPNDLSARVTDNANNMFETPAIRVTMDNTVPFDIGFDPIPDPNSLKPVPLSGWAKDNAKLSKVELFWDLPPVKMPVSTTVNVVDPADWTWTASIPAPREGLNQLQLKVTDEAGGVGTKAATFVWVKPDTDPPKFLSKTVSGPVTCPAGTASLHFKWDTDEDAKTMIEYTTDPGWAPATIVTFIDNAFVKTHDYTFNAGIALGTIYYYRITSTDAANNAATEQDQVTTAAGCDVTPPTVTIAPLPGILTGVKVVTVNARDSSGVTDIALFVDGVPEGAPVHCNVADCTNFTTAFSWNTATVANGNHTLRAEATDPIPNTGVDQIGVDTSNDITAPRVSGISDNGDPALCNAGGPTCDVRISWCTDEASTSKVEYGIENVSTGKYMYDQVQAGDDCLPVACAGIGHCVTLRDLELNRRYHYRVESCDAFNNCGH